MGMLARNGLNGFPKNGISEGRLTSMEGVGTNNPHSSRFQRPEWLKPTPYSLVFYLKQVHEEHHLPFGEMKIHFRMAKKLLEEYDLDTLARAICQAGRVAKHPFTMKFVREQIQKCQSSVPSST